MSIVLPTATRNPFVGPRAFRTGERLHARERETQRIVDLLIAERIVLLYSPSGAGKTSLINAALVPDLRAERFQVSPIVRVGMELGAVEQGEQDANRYVLSTLLSLEEGLPPGKQRDLAELCRLSLDEYLRDWGLLDEAGAGNELLIFDQFEEILTADATDEDGRRRFFEELGGALRDRGRWALFAMREEFVAGLDPYLPLLPTKLRTRVRLDLLQDDGAMRAIQKPAAEAGREITDAAARRLVDELRLVHVQRGDERVQLPGPFVEPVQLQVVCSRLWETAGSEVERIDVQHVDALGDVERTLGDYYAERVASVAVGAGVPERLIREWFDDELITQTGFRAQVPYGPHGAGDAESRVVGLLEDAHLIRAENRRGTRWIELAHDRLVEPVRNDNIRWRAEHLSDLQRQAARWQAAGRREELLLAGAALAAAEAKMAAQAEDLTAVEQDFWEASLAARRARRRQRRATTVTWVSAILTLALTAAIFGIVVAVRASEESNRLAKLARSGQLATTATSLLDEQPELARLIALKAFREDPTNEAANALAAALTRPTFRLDERWRHDADVSDVAFSPDGELIATANDDGTLRLWATSTGLPQGQPLGGHDGHVLDVTFSPDGQLLASRADDGTVRLWDTASGEPHGRPLEGPAAEVPVAFSPDGGLLATAGDEGTVQLWRTDTGEPEGEPYGDPDGGLLAVTFSPDGDLLATGNLWGVSLWDTATGQRRGQSPEGPVGEVGAVAFSPDGQLLASGSMDGTLRLWRTRTGEPQGRPLGGHNSAVLAVSFATDGRRITSAGADGTVRLWEPATGAPLTDLLDGPASSSRAAAIDPEGQLLASANEDGTVRLLEIVETEPPLGAPLLVHEEVMPVEMAAIGPDGTLLASAYQDGTIQLWDTTTGARRGEPLAGHDAGVSALTFSTDGELLASGDWDGSVRLWDTDDGGSRGQLSSGQGSIIALSLSPDGQLLVSGGTDGSLRLWETTTGAPQGDPLTGHTDWVRAVTFSPDGQLIASVSDDAAVRLWETRTGTSLGEPLVGHDEWVFAVAFSPDGRLLASGDVAGALQLWETATREPRGEPLLALDDEVGAIAFSPDGQLVTATDGGTVRIWETSTGEVRDDGLSADDEGRMLALTFGPDGEELTTASDDGTVRRWNAATGAVLEELLLEGALGPVPTWAVALSPDGSVIASADSGGSVRFWDADSGAPRGEVATGPGVSALAFSPDGQLLAAADWGGSVGLWDADDGTSRGELTTDDAEISALAFSPDGHLLATADWEGTIRLWEVDSRELRAEVSAGQSESTPLIAFSPDGGVIVSVDEGSERVRRWDTATGEPRDELHTSQAGGLSAVGYSPDGRLLATAGWDGSVRLWDPDSGETRGELSAGPAGVMTMAFSADGRVLASAGWDGTVRLWDPADGASVASLQTDHTPWGPMVAFSHDASRLVTAHDDGTIRSWPLETEAWERMVCQAANRNMSGPEWDTWIGGGREYEPTCPMLPVGRGALEGLVPLEVGRLSGADAVLGRLLVDIDAAERAMLDYQRELSGVSGGFGTDGETSERRRGIAAASRSQLVEVRGRLTGELGSEPAERVRASYLTHLDAWVGSIQAIEEDRPFDEGAGDDDPIGSSATAFSRALEDALPEDVDAEVRRFAESILNRGFR
jgi:WD40 repeat protein